MFKRLSYIESTLIPNIGVIFFIISAIWMFIESLSRQLFSRSFAISEEVILFSLIWAIFLTLAQSGREGYHIYADLFVRNLPVRIKKIVNIITFILSLGYSILIFLSAVKFIPHLYKTKVISSSPLQLPMWLVLTVIPIGAMLLSIYYFSEILSLIKNYNQSVENDNNVKTELM